MIEMRTAACQRHGMANFIVFMYGKFMVSWQRSRVIYTDNSLFLNIKFQDVLFDPSWCLLNIYIMLLRSHQILFIFTSIGYGTVKVVCLYSTIPTTVAFIFYNR
jgi:hypothetical protein